jgi:tRNA(Ile)-lysidine synthase
MGPRLDERLARLADLLRDEEEILECAAKERLQQVMCGGDLVRERLLQECKAMQRRIVRLWLETTLGDLRGIGFDHVDKILEFIHQGPSQAALSIPKGWTVIKQYDAARLERRGRRRKRVCYSYELPAEGELVIPEAGMKILSSRSSISFGARPRDNLEALFDLAFLPGTLTVRNFRNGDRFQPLGMRGHRKVKDLFIEKRVSLTVRAILPLLVAGDEILWIPRFGRSEVAKISPETREVLRVRLVMCEG